MTEEGLPQGGAPPGARDGASGRVPRAKAMSLLLGSFVVASLAIVALWLVAGNFDPGRLHIHGLESRLNDQAGYVTSARILADTGELRSGLVLPAFADNPRSRVYMPGHYALLALSYKLFGYSVWASLLPNLLAFVLSAVGVFLIGARYYGALAGAAAALFTIAFPPNLLFAFTAMAEGTVLAVGITSFCIFTFLGARARLMAAPLLVATTFLFRETGALWVIPMALLVLFESKERRWRRTILVALATVAVVFSANRWQLATGKEAPPLTWLMGSRFNYGDAQAAIAPESSIALADVPGLALVNAQRNVENLREKVLAAPGRFEGGSILALLGIVLATLVTAVVRIRRDPLPMAAALLALATWALAFGLYDVVGLKLLRSSMFFVPLCAIALAGTAAGRRGLAGVWALPMLVALSIGTWFAWSAPVCRLAGIEVVAGDAEADAALDYVERLGHDEETLLVAPWLLGLEYAVAHYPVRYSFPVANGPTLRALGQSHQIGTLIVPRAKAADLRQGAIERAGLVPVGQFGGSHTGGRFLVFQRPR